jgi:arsenate reductase
MKVYGLTTCRKTQKALAWFKAHDIPVEFHNFKTDGISFRKLQEWDSQAGYDLFLNKKGSTWKKLSPEIRESVKTKEDARALLKEHPAIIKRPVIEDGGFLLFGFDEKMYEEHFLKKQP